MTRDDTVLFKNYRSIYLTEQNSSIPGPTPSGSPSPPEGPQKSPGDQDLNNMISGAWFVAQVIDPTGVLSYGDLIKQAKRWNNDPSYINTVLLGICIYCAFPNFGILAAGFGGAAWAGIKAGLQKAVRKAAETGNFNNVLSEFDKLLSMVQRSKWATNFVTQKLEGFKKAGVINQAGYEDLFHALTKKEATLNNIAYRDNIVKSLKDVSSFNLPNTAENLTKMGKNFLKPSTNAGQRIRSATGKGITQTIEKNPEYSGKVGYRKQISLSQYEKAYNKPFKLEDGTTPKVGDVVDDNNKENAISYVIVP